VPRKSRNLLQAFNAKRCRMSCKLPQGASDLAPPGTHGIDTRVNTRVDTSRPVDARAAHIRTAQ
jgi:hypothetical protein